MGYENHIYERAEAELNLRRLKAEAEQQRHIQEIETKFPEIIEINRTNSFYNSSVLTIIINIIIFILKDCAVKIPSLKYTYLI